MVLWKSTETTHDEPGDLGRRPDPSSASPGRSSSSARAPRPPWRERLDLTPAAVRRHLDHMLDERHRRGPRPAASAAAAAAAARPRSSRSPRRDATSSSSSTTTWPPRPSGSSPAPAATRPSPRSPRSGSRGSSSGSSRSRPPTPSSARARRWPAPCATPASPPRSAPCPIGEQLCQQHCPVAHVAHEFPQLCEAETELISRVARPPRPAAGHHRPRRRRLHHQHPDADLPTAHHPDPPRAHRNQREAVLDDHHDRAHPTPSRR